MTTKQVPLTKDGLKKLEAELDELIHVRRPAVAQRIHDEKELVGAQNAPEYEDARDEQAWVEGRIQQVQDMIQNAVIFEESHDHQTVSLGSNVEVKDQHGKKQKFLIVGGPEANPREGKVSNESPVGMALLGKKVGDTAEVNAPAGTLVWTILKVD
jgi:transcription elongation factor GreA